MSQLMPENVTRRLDSLGRVTLPKGLRDRFYLSEGSEIELYTTFIDGRHCICLIPPVSAEEEIENAIAVLAQHGIEVKRE